MDEQTKSIVQSVKIFHKKGGTLVQSERNRRTDDERDNFSKETTKCCSQPIGAKPSIDQERILPWIAGGLLVFFFSPPDEKSFSTGRLDNQLSPSMAGYNLLLTRLLISFFFLSKGKEVATFYSSSFLRLFDRHYPAGWSLQILFFPMTRCSRVWLNLERSPSAFVEFSLIFLTVCIWCNCCRTAAAAAEAADRLFLVWQRRIFF